MLQMLHAELCRLCPIPESIWEQSKAFFYIRQLKAQEMFQEPNTSPFEVGLVANGLMRAYFTKSEKEMVKMFATRGQFIGAYAALLSNNQSKLSIIAEKDSVLFCIRFADLEKLYSLHPCWQEIGRKAAEQLLLTREKREYELLMLSALERYEEFLREFPSLSEDIPQWQIASYLGITPVALSRIRKQRVTKK